MRGTGLLRVENIYQQCKKLPVAGYQRDQLLRASLSICDLLQTSDHLDASLYKLTQAI